MNDTNNLYVQRINQRKGNLFGRQFTELINEYDNTRYVLRTKIDSTDFKKFITNIVVKVNTTDDMYPEADE